MNMAEFETPVEHVCGPDADPTFDQLIAALGHIAKQKPKPLIDTIMVWRKSKGDAAAAAKQMLNQVSVFFGQRRILGRLGFMWLILEPE